MNRLVFILVAALVFLLLDIYAFQAIRHVWQNFSSTSRKVIAILYWSVSILAITGFLAYNLGGQDMPRGLRTFFFSLIFINYFSKIFGILFLLIDDLARVGKWVWVQVLQSSRQAGASSTMASPTREGISRADFLVKSSLIATAVPAVTMGFGILSGAHDYRVRKVRITLPKLPASFDGIRLAQISDIHSGSFFNKTAVRGGVDMLMQEKPDVVFFTGDLVNNTADEIKDYINIFDKVKAPMGVYSTLGNHDYGNYKSWPSARARQQNLKNLMQAHHIMGWELLMNEHRMLEQGGDSIAVLGVENWGAGRFAKYGDLRQAYQGSEESDVKLLLSHDPSHWDAQVRPWYPDIDLMFSGHTHGFQFGIEVGDFKWSPSQYIYKQWAGLYQAGRQYLYVNRGYGYLGFPGRIGMLPEITIVELNKGS